MIDDLSNEREREQKVRPVKAEVIDRYPQTDRQQGAFPTELISYFFAPDEHLERIPSDQTAEAYLGRKLAPDNFSQAVLTVLDGEMMNCTCHMFYDDLQALNETLNLRPEIELPRG